MCKLFRFKNLNGNNDASKDTVFNAEQIVNIEPNVKDRDGFGIIIIFNGGSIEKEGSPTHEEMFFFDTKEQRDEALKGLYALTGPVTEI